MLVQGNSSKCPPPNFLEWSSQFGTVFPTLLNIFFLCFDRTKICQSLDHNFNKKKFKKVQIIFIVLPIFFEPEKARIKINEKFFEKIQKIEKHFFLFSG